MKKSVLLFVMVCLVAETWSADRILLFDFGTEPVPAGRDAQGNYWNQVNAPVLHYTVDSTNGFATIGLQFKTDYAAGANGGLRNPDIALLGRLAAAPATSNYFFNATANKHTFTLTVLDPADRYDLRFFATRNSSDVRKTRYSVTDANGTVTADLQTSGSGVSKDGLSGGNDWQTAVFTNLTPVMQGEIEISYEPLSGGFSYIGAMELIVHEAPSPPLSEGVSNE